MNSPSNTVTSFHLKDGTIETHRGKEQSEELEVESSQGIFPSYQLFPQKNTHVFSRPCQPRATRASEHSG
jgi:hypothetical protein